MSATWLDFAEPYFWILAAEAEPSLWDPGPGPTREIWQMCLLFRTCTARERSVISIFTLDISLRILSGETVAMKNASMFSLISWFTG